MKVFKDQCWSLAYQIKCLVKYLWWVHSLKFTHDERLCVVYRIKIFDIILLNWYNFHIPRTKESDKSVKCLYVTISRWNIHITTEIILLANFKHFILSKKKRKKNATPLFPVDCCVFNFKYIYITLMLRNFHPRQLNSTLLHLQTIFTPFVPVSEFFLKGIKIWH